MASLLKENIKSVSSAATKPAKHRRGQSILLELTSINMQSGTRIRINTPKVKFSSHLPQIKKPTMLKRAVIVTSPVFWLLKPQKFISQCVSNISGDYEVSKRSRQQVGAFPFLSQSWQIGRGLEQLVNLKGDDLTPSLFSFSSSQNSLPEYFFPIFTVSYSLLTVFCPTLSVASIYQSVNKMHNCLH